MNLRAQPKSFWWAVASCVAMVVGSFGPWARVVGAWANLVGPLSVSGIDVNDGRTVIGAAVVALALILLRQRRARGVWPLVLAFLAASLGAAIAVYDWTDISRFASETGIADTAWGVYFAAVGSVSLALASVGMAIETHVPKTRKTRMTGVPRPSH